jgi:hypothetical protein
MNRIKIPLIIGLALLFIVPQSMIVRLYLGRCPAAVAWLVIAIVIYSVYAQSRWAWPHIGQKVLELSPALANFNSPSTIARPLFSLGIFAPKAHRVPNTIFRRMARIAMFQRSFSLLAPIYCKASTAFCIPVPKAISKSLNLFTAAALAIPNCCPMLIYEGEG